MTETFSPSGSTLAEAEAFLAAHPGRVQLWIAGHTHTHPDDNFGGKSHIEQRWGTWFLNVASLSRHHMPITTLPLSRLLVLHLRSFHPCRLRT